MPANRCVAWMALLLTALTVRAETFRVACYNVESYLDQPTESRPEVKSPVGRAKVRESIRAMQPDVISLEEMGDTNALMELRASLKADGLDYPYWEHVAGADTNIHVAVLSRFPIVANRPHTNETYLLDGRRSDMSRGIADLDIRVNDHFTFTLIGAHLKSKRRSTYGDEAQMRLEEARLLREVVDARFAADPNARLIVLGDFNDTPNARSIRTIIGHGRFQLVDTRPAERNGDDQPNPENPNWAPRSITWTEHFSLEDVYSRIDYILLSPAMARDWSKTGTYIPTIRNWGVGSDHRPLVAEFDTGSR